MIDLSKVSQKVITEFKKLTEGDGKKGISNSNERNKIAELLSNCSGNYDTAYLNEQIVEFDLKEAKNNASQDVVKDIEKLKKMDGNKNDIDSDKEIAVLDAIIDNTLGNYSPEDIEYAKLVKKKFGLAEKTPLAEEKAKNQRLNAHLEEAREKLSRQNEYIKNLEAALAEKEGEIQEAIANGQIDSEEITNLKTQLSEMAEQNKKLSENLNKIMDKELELDFERATNMPAEILTPAVQPVIEQAGATVNVSEALAKILKGAHTVKLAE